MYDDFLFPAEKSEAVVWYHLFEKFNLWRRGGILPRSTVTTEATSRFADNLCLGLFEPRTMGIVLCLFLEELDMFFSLLDAVPSLLKSTIGSLFRLFGFGDFLTSRHYGRVIMRKAISAETTTEQATTAGTSCTTDAIRVGVTAGVVRFVRAVGRSRALTASKEGSLARVVLLRRRRRRRRVARALFEERHYRKIECKT
jgi:hypothetical protein